MGDPATLLAARAELSALLDDPATPIAMDLHEYGILRERIARPARHPGLPDEYALYRKRGTPDSYQDALWTLIDVGATVNLAAAAPVLDAEPLADPPARGAARGRPIVAIIDDSIGFLNARFRVRNGRGFRSRFRALWVQGVETASIPRGGAPRRVHLGHVLTQADIDDWLALGDRLDEGAVYGALNAALCRPHERRSTDFAVTHGTHILDLAAGADPDDAGDPVRDWPLLGVQLPAAAIEDTSGVKFENYMVQGMRWILRQAHRLDRTAPVIVNLSMGIVAGAKDGTRFSEYQIAREARMWESATGQPVRVAWSFGNAFRGNLVARHSYKARKKRKKTDRTLLWRIQPDEETPSFVELHSDPATPSTALEVALTGPDGLSSGFAPVAPGEVRTLLRGGKGDRTPLPRARAPAGGRCDKGRPSRHRRGADRRQACR